MMNPKSTARLDFPIEIVMDAHGRPTRRYLIPPEKRKEVLDQLWIFAEPPPSLSDEMFDLHAKKTFRVRDFQVVREPEKDALVSPYFLQSGGTVMDWWPPKEKGDTLIRRLKGQNAAVITGRFQDRD
jgi:hypothetical protein